MKHGKVWIGTSGYSYKDWGKGNIYPAGLPSGRWFEHYATLFPTVELNVTFYRLPSPDTFRGWLRRSPPGFRFFVKGSRYITHVKRLRDPAPSLEKFFRLALLLKDRLAAAQRKGIRYSLKTSF